MMGAEGEGGVGMQWDKGKMWGTSRESGAGEGVPGIGSRQGLRGKCWRRGCDEQELKPGYFPAVWRARLL